MNAIHLLRGMHAASKMQFKIILGTDDPAQAGDLWKALQPVLELHEALEDELLYGPLQAELGDGTPLGDWEMQHAADVEIVQELVGTAQNLEPGTPAWRMCIATISDALRRHIMDEEGQIFPRIEQLWGSARLEEVGAQMQAATDKATGGARSAKARTRARTTAVATGRKR
jgi:iron-sulfur cluster repair protein YtfE (RIC family)